MRNFGLETGTVKIMNLCRPKFTRSYPIGTEYLSIFFFFCSFLAIDFNFNNLTRSYVLKILDERNISHSCKGKYEQIILYYVFCIFFFFIQGFTIFFR